MRVLRFPLVLVIAVAGLAPLACGSGPAIQRANPSAADAAAAPGPGDAAFGFVVPEAGSPAADGPMPGAPIGNQPSCAAQSFTAERLPLDIVILADASGSMGELVAGTQTIKWQLVQDALYAFVRDPGSAGLGIGLQFFPLTGGGTPCRTNADCGLSDQVCEQYQACVTPGKPAVLAVAPGCSVWDQVPCQAPAVCQTVGTCAVSNLLCYPLGSICPGGNSSDVCIRAPTTCFAAAPTCVLDSYATLAVPIADLPGAVPAFVRTLALRRPAGQTPLFEGSVGALKHLRARLAASPGRRAALVIATDGLPGGCGNQDISTIADNLYTARNGTPSVSTFVVGVLDAKDVEQGRRDFGQLALAGGTAAPFILSPNQDLTKKLVEALSQIRGSLACEYAIPPEKKGMIDFDKVNLHFSAPMVDEDIPYVAGADRCDPTRGGWYYDTDPRGGGAPSRVVACGATCKRFQSQQSGKIELRFGCKTVVIQ
jgi:hypothetical protein